MYILIYTRIYLLCIQSFIAIKVSQPGRRGRLRGSAVRRAGEARWRRGVVGRSGWAEWLAHSVPGLRRLRAEAPALSIVY